MALKDGGKFAVSASWDKTMKLWNLETGETMQTFNGQSAEVTSVRLSSDFKLALSGSGDKKLNLWNLEPFITGLLAADSPQVSTEAPVVTA